MRYFFNIRDAAGLIPDEEGGEFRNLNAARGEAAASARDFAMDDLRCGNLINPRSIEITDERGTLLETIMIRDILMAH
jgi:hypothetical protein